LMLTQAGQGALALTLGLLVWSEGVRYWHIAAMAVTWGIMSALDRPARQSFILEMVGREHLVSAIGMNSAAFNGARIVGPAVAGVLIARVGLFAGFI
ncbi:MAG TPA: MFS transporter, partial [Candidatus Binatia bacterium]|nr:MFS transporter [Candidatus Binatia bacterium]